MTDSHVIRIYKGLMVAEAKFLAITSPDPLSEEEIATMESFDFDSFEVVYPESYEKHIEITLYFALGDRRFRLDMQAGEHWSMNQKALEEIYNYHWRKR